MTIMKRMRTRVFTIVLCAAISAAIPATPAAADVKITVTFAAGGAASGFYLFFYYSSGFKSDWQNKRFDSPALLNYSQEGWQVKPPVLHFTGDNNKNTVSYAEIIRIRF